MSFHLQLPSVPDCSNPVAIRQYLFQQRELLIRLLGHINDLGCGIEFDTDNRLAVGHNVESVVCGTAGVSAVAFAGMVKGSKRHQSGTMIAAGVID